MPINAQVVAWARQRLGQRVGDGECWTLCEQAIVNSNGVSSRTLTPNFGAQSDYVWGDTAALASLQAGDVLQFRNYRWTKTTRTDEAFSDGSSSFNTQTETQTRPHHSAVVGSAASAGMVEVLEQNVDPGGRIVQANTLCLTTQSPPPTVLAIPGGTRTTTVTHAVSGTVRAYRPRQRP